MQLNRRIILSLMIGIAFSGTAIFISFRNVPLAQLLGYVATINLWWIIPATLKPLHLSGQGAEVEGDLKTH